MLLRFIGLPLATAILLAVPGCALLNSKSSATPDSQFRNALSVCRFQHTGRTNRKMALKPAEEHVAKCLARRGWTPSGEALPPGGKNP